MKLMASRRTVMLRALVWITAGWGVWLGPAATAATPDSPEVRAMVERGLQHLNSGWKSTTHAERLGGVALVGLAAYKYEKRFGGDQAVIPDLTLQALKRVMTTAHEANGLRYLDNYSLGIALVLLTEVSPAEHTGEIGLLLEELLQRQKPNGSWGYPGSPLGDTSQLQYAAFGLWAAKNSGCQVPPEVAVNLANYVMRVQDPSGCWGYQGNDPGTFTRVTQAPTRPSLGVAGLGTLYVVSDLLGLSRPGVQRQAPKGSVPAVFQPVASESHGLRNRASIANLPMSTLKQAISDGNAWFRSLPTLQTQTWQYYFLYGLERYQSFRELVEGTEEAEPRWYNDGVRLLQMLQRDTGQWDSLGSGAFAPQDTDSVVNTAFAMLFLLRSTRETIEKVVERDGALRGGYDLPTDLSAVRVRDNRLVAPAVVGEVADMIGMLESGETDKIDSLLDHPDALSLEGLADAGRAYSERLARVLRTGSYQARIVAARALGRQVELDNVPILIYALTDGDPRVVREAQAGLRLTSRKFDGIELPEDFTPADRDAVVAQWQTWYKSVRPDAVFIDPAPDGQK